jgi:hypothetical protein
MLAEFAFTPSIFDENIHDDKEAWREQLKELGRNMFPQVSACPAIVSDLYDGSWSRNATDIVNSIEDRKAKDLCLRILKNIRKVLVKRPICGDWPIDDSTWAREAVASNRVEAIERIVADNQTKMDLQQEFAMVRSLAEVEERGFWRGIVSDASPRMIIKEQVYLLKKIWMHSDWVALINPYCCGSEQDFTLELIQCAFRRSPVFGTSLFEIHGQEDKIAANIFGQIGSRLAHGQVVKIYSWPKLLDRLFLAGTFSFDSDGTKKKHVRWGVSMSHVAHGNAPNAPTTEWKLLRDESLDSWNHLYVAEDAELRPTPTSITATNGV